MTTVELASCRDSFVKLVEPLKRRVAGSHRVSWYVFQERQFTTWIQCSGLGQPPYSLSLRETSDFVNQCVAFLRAFYPTSFTPPGVPQPPIFDAALLTRLEHTYRDDSDAQEVLKVLKSLGIVKEETSKTVRAWGLL